MTIDERLEGSVAIVSMAGRFAGASTIEQFWQNIRNGVESVRDLTEDEMVTAGVSLDEIRAPGYVARAAPLDDTDLFDAGLFNMSPRDAAVFDPQHRVFLECAYETFERAGYAPGQIEGAVGVFASCGAPEYMFKNVLGNAAMTEAVGEWLIRHTGNDTNFLATRVSYEFNLEGPSLNVQTACSSTLVAIHLACQSILSGECDMALAGGAVIAPRQLEGYVYREGEVLSPDGHCRPFDAHAAGTVLSDGAGAVLLKPLADAVADGDTVIAIIRGSAINNDGNDKVGYLAPSVGGQARVIAEALAVSGVDASEVSYLEAHGTGTIIGDPIEVAGATEAFREHTADTQFCALGSLKANIGHLGEAAGVAAVIKTAMALQHAELPPSVNYESPNPRIDFANSPFVVNDTLRPWDTGGKPRIAGVTSLGAGGTNAHVLLEEAPVGLAPASAPDTAKPRIVPISARSEASVGELCTRLGSFLDDNPATSLADVSYTLFEGRERGRSRRAFVAHSVADAIAALLEDRTAGPAVAQGTSSSTAPIVAFMMPGGGAQYINMGRGLYQTEPVYRAAIDRCADFISPQLGGDLRSFMYQDESLDIADKALQAPSLSLPVLVATGWAMGELLESYGVVADCHIGHSAGEYVAACRAGVMSIEDALALVALRGRLFETLPPGGMLSVSLSEQALLERLPEGLSIASINSPTSAVASGPVPLLEDLESALAADDIDCLRVHIQVAGHSAMLDPILDEFRAFCRTIELSEPTTGLISNLTGEWVADGVVTDPEYWVRHLREPVRFHDGISTLVADESIAARSRVLIEIGPGRSMVSLARAAPGSSTGITTLRHPKEDADDVTVFLHALATAWTVGVELGSAALTGAGRRRLSLPPTPFEHERYWVDPDEPSAPTAAAGPLRKRHELSSWFAVPQWTRSVPPSLAAPSGPETDVSLILDDAAPAAAALAERLRARGQRVVTVGFDTRYRWVDDDSCRLDPGRLEDWVGFVQGLSSRGLHPAEVFHLAGTTERSTGRRSRTTALGRLDAAVETDYASLVFFARAISGLHKPMRLVVATTGVHDVSHNEPLDPSRALMHGASRVIPRELGQVSAVAVDLAMETVEATVDALVREGAAGDSRNGPVVAWRGRERFELGLESITIPAQSDSPWRADGTYLITGGLGGIGLTVANRIAETAPGATIVLIGRTPLAADTPDASPRERRRLDAVAAIRERGCTVLVESADITDRSTMDSLLRRVVRQHGAITGVIHTAGVLQDALIELRSPQPGSPVIDIKVRGLLILDELLQKSPPELMVLCSSVSSLLGLPGQVDYTAANAFLDAFAAAKNRDTSTRAVVVNWNAWREVGMAVEAIESIEGNGEGAGSATTSGHPTRMLEPLGVHDDTIVMYANLNRSSSWLLAEHVVRGGDALIPGTGFVELIRGAVAGRGPSRLEDVFFLTPFEVGANETRELHLSVEADGSVTITSGDGLVTHATATATALGSDVVPPAALDIAAIEARCAAQVDDFDGYSDQPFMEFGPRWGNLRRVSYGTREAVVRTVMPEAFRSETTELWLHPGVLDIAIGSAQALIPGFDQKSSFFVPLSYSRALSFSPIPADARTHIRLRDSDTRDLAVFDATICDEGGVVAAEITGFTMRRVDVDGSFGSPRSVGTVQSKSPIVDALREGIEPEEGAEALDRLLAVDLGPQVVASSVDVDLWRAHVDAEAGGGTGASPIHYARPDLESEFAEPASPFEIELAAMWRDLLGVDRVGRDDDFFELGGQSLIAVRLFTRIRKKFAIDLEISTLFEAPTVAQCAAVLAGRLGSDDSPVDVTDGPPKSLVTIQKGGDRTPVFCVHGAGGNVLNFRDLALAMGRDQPFYGLQARGIDGITRPLESIEAMAAAYLADVRTVQPEGPYRFAGYSGGGLVAFEMARQARDAGDAIELVLLLDTFPPKFEMRRSSLAHVIGEFVRNPTGYPRDILEGRKAARIANEARDRLRRILAADETVPNDLRELHLEDHFAAVAANYVRRPWAGRVVLLRAETVFWAFSLLDETYGWSDVVTDGFQLVSVAGDHATLVLEPNVSQLVDAISDVLRPEQVRVAGTTAGAGTSSG